MANPTVRHRKVTGAVANPKVLVDGPAWDDTHEVAGLENVPNVDTSQAANINFTQSGTGAVTRTMQDKARDIISVTDFGASSAVANNQPAFQAALDYAASLSGPSYGGAVVTVPAGVFFLTAGLTMPTSFVALQGAGKQATFLAFANGTGDCVTIGSASAPSRMQSITDLEIFGQSKTGGANLKILNCFDPLIQRVQIEGAVTGIDVGPGTNGVTLRDTIIIPNATSPVAGIYWNASGDGTTRSDVLAFYNVVIEGHWGDAIGLIREGWVNTLVGSGLRMLHLRKGWEDRNTANSVSYYPAFTNLFDLELEGFKDKAMTLLGVGHKFTNSDVNNLTGGTDQGNADTVAIEILADASYSVTRDIQFSILKVGNCRTHAIITNGRNVRLMGVSCFTASMASVGGAAALRVGASAQDTEIVGLIGEEYGGAGKASYALQIDSGALRTSYTAVSGKYCQSGSVLDSSASSSTSHGNRIGHDGVAYGPKAFGVGTGNPVVDGAILSVKDASTGMLTSQIANTSVGANVGARWMLATGTVNSFAVGELHDNNGAPYYLESLGAAVTARYYDSDAHFWRSRSSGTDYGNLTSTGLHLTIDLAVTEGGTGASTAAGAIGGLTNALTAKTTAVPSTDMLAGYDAAGATGKKFAVETVAAPATRQHGYITGRYYTGGNGSPSGGSSMVLVANTLYATPFYIGKKITWTTIAIDVVTLAGTGIRLGIFDATGSGGGPGSLVLDAGTVSSASTGVKTITISQALEIGLYYLVAVSDGTPTVRAFAGAGNAANSNLPSDVFGVATPGTPDLQASKSFTYGALSGASPFGAITFTNASTVMMLMKP